MKIPGKMLGEVLRHVGKTPATVHYPSVHVEMPTNYRGRIVFHAEKCVGCKLCQKDCPAAALTINKVGDKRFEAIFDLDRCVFCSQCVDSCNKHALETTKEYELAVLNRSDLRVVFHAPPAPEVPAPAATEAAAGNTVAAPKSETATPPSGGPSNPKPNRGAA